MIIELTYKRQDRVYPNFSTSLPKHISSDLYKVWLHLTADWDVYWALRTRNGYKRTFLVTILGQFISASKLSLLDCPFWRHFSFMDPGQDL